MSSESDTEPALPPQLPDDLRPTRHVEIRKLGAVMGWRWISAAWTLFSRDWLIWVAIGIVYTVFYVLMQIIPLGSLAGGLLAPVFLGGIIAGAAKVEAGDSASFSFLFTCFKRDTAALIGIGALSLTATLVLSVLSALFFILLVGFDSLISVANTPELLASGGPISRAFFAALLVWMALYLPVLMMLWFAPALVVMNHYPVFSALSLSFKGCLANVIPFTVYGVIAMFLMIIAVITFGLGFIVYLPVSFLAMYTAYKTIFVPAEQGAVSTGTALAA